MQLIIPFPAHARLSLEVCVQDEYITRIKYILTTQIKSTQTREPGENTSAQIKHIKAEFLNYFKDPACLFSLQYQLDAATVFQQRVWKALTEIPCGEVRTYTALAKQLNSSPRAIGNACRVNPLPVIIPCHRVVSVSGIGGYAGDTQEKQKGSIDFVAIKLWLLEHERLLEHEKAPPG